MILLLIILSVFPVCVGIALTRRALSTRPSERSRGAESARRETSRWCAIGAAIAAIVTIVVWGTVLAAGEGILLESWAIGFGLVASLPVGLLMIFMTCGLPSC